MNLQTSSPIARAALLFPGQGSQTVGMGKEICDNFAVAREVFERSDRALGIPLARTCFEGPAESLRLTATTQPALLATSIALLDAMLSRLPDGAIRRFACAAHLKSQVGDCWMTATAALVGLVGFGSSAMEASTCLES